MDAYRAFYPVGKALLRLMLRLMGGVDVEGATYLPTTGRVILAPNHRSDCDPVFIGAAAARPPWFVAKGELFDIPVLGPFIRFLRAIPIKRDAADRQAIRRIEELLSQGEAVVIFPEGRVSPTGAFQPLEPGIALIALRTKTPILPVGLVGTERVVPYGRFVPRPSFRPTLVRFGAPMAMDDIIHNVRRREQVEAVMGRLEEEMKKLMRDER